MSHSESAVQAPTKKRFRPVRSSVKKIMGRVGEPGVIRRTNTVILEEDLAIQVMNKVAARAGSFVQSNARSKVTKKDVIAAIKLEFGEAFADKAVTYVDEVLKRVE